MARAARLSGAPRGGLRAGAAAADPEGLPLVVELRAVEGRVAEGGADTAVSTARLRALAAVHRV